MNYELLAIGIDTYSLITVHYSLFPNHYSQKNCIFAP